MIEDLCFTVHQSENGRTRGLVQSKKKQSSLLKFTAFPMNVSIKEIGVRYLNKFLKIQVSPGLTAKVLCQFWRKFLGKLF